MLRDETRVLCFASTTDLYGWILSRGEKVRRAPQVSSHHDHGPAHIESQAREARNPRLVGSTRF